MTPADVERYPELRQLCGAYLNADYVDEYGSVDEALRAYRLETGANHRLAALNELDQLLAGAASDAVIAAEIEALGCEIYFARPALAREIAEAIRRALAE